MSKIMTIAEVREWLSGGDQKPNFRAVVDEMQLIESCEKMKHNHFSIESMRATFKDIQFPENLVVMAKVHALADTKNITLKPNDQSSDKFFQLMGEAMKQAIPKIKKMIMDAGIVGGDEESMDDNGRCVHDMNLDSRIDSSLEYITTLIKGTL